MSSGSGCGYQKIVRWIFDGAVKIGRFRGLRLVNEDFRDVNAISIIQFAMVPEGSSNRLLRKRFGYWNIIDIRGVLGYDIVQIRNHFRDNIMNDIQPGYLQLKRTF